MCSRVRDRIASQTDNDDGVHIYIDCDIAKNLWKETEIWFRSMYDNRFKIADVEKIFGSHDNDQINNRNTGKRMKISDFKGIS